MMFAPIHYFMPALGPRATRVLLLLLLTLFASQCAHAHKPSDSYLNLKVNGQHIEGQWDIALRDLDFAIGLDRDGNGELTWDEVKANHQAIAAYALAHLHLSGETDCPLSVTAHLIDRHTDGHYAVLRLAATCSAPVSRLTLDYRLFFDLDPQHKGLLNLSLPGQAVQTAVFSHDQGTQSFTIGQASNWQQFGQYVQHGVWHIWIGFDHVLFLLSLLLPAVLVWMQPGDMARPHPATPVTRAGWQASDSFRAALVEVCKVVSAFTLAHSITLSLASLQWIALPSRLVESCIAASVLLAAINNIKPIVRGKRWVVAFGFGLIHGFGFASVLSDLGLPQASLVLALLGFNLGVEIGQLAIVAAFLPIAFALRQTWLYRRVILGSGSVAIAVLACVWLAERALDFKLDLPGLGWLA